MFATVITTIQEPTDAVVKLVQKLAHCGGLLVVAGDRKGPAYFRSPHFAEGCRLDFLSLADQQESEFELARRLPVGCYSRKNVGYLHAMAAGADLLYETDDDNAPLDSWQIRSETVAAARSIESANGRWVNAYRYFSSELIWPRGFPLSEIRSDVPESRMVAAMRSPIQQGLANGSPDVDAVWRLILDRKFAFTDDAPVMLEHVVVADSIPVVIPSKLLLLSDVRHLEKFYRSAMSLGARVRNYISCSRSVSGSQSA